MPLTVHQFPCLSDNYGFLIRDEATGKTACIDTPDAGAILQIGHDSVAVSVLAFIGIGIFAIPAAILSSALSDQLRIEREKMMNELYHMLEDGVISAEEQELIEAEAKRLHLSKSELDRLLEKAKVQMGVDHAAASSAANGGSYELDLKFLSAHPAVAAFEAQRNFPRGHLELHAVRVGVGKVVGPRHRIDGVRRNHALAPHCHRPRALGEIRHLRCVDEMRAPVRE